MEVHLIVPIAMEEKLRLRHPRKAARTVGAGVVASINRVMDYPSSCPGLTRASIFLRKNDGLPGQARQ